MEITSNQQSAGGAVARVESLMAPPCLRNPVTNGTALISGGLAAAPAPGSHWGHEHAKPGLAVPKAQIIGPENTETARPIDLASTGEDGNGAGPPDDKGARPPTLAAELVRAS